MGDSQCGWVNHCLPHVGPGTPLSPLSIYFSPFHFSLSFIGFTYFLLLYSPSLSTRIVPLRFQAGGRRRRPNLGLVCVLFCTLCYLYSLVRCIVVLCSVWFSVLCVPSVLWHCWLGHWPVKTRPHMTYIVFGGTLSLTQSVNLLLWLVHVRLV